METQISTKVLRSCCLAVTMPFQWVKIVMEQAKCQPECHLIQWICNPALSNACTLSWGQGGPPQWIKTGLLQSWPALDWKGIIPGIFENEVSKSRLIKREGNLQSFHNSTAILTYLFTVNWHRHNVISFNIVNACLFHTAWLTAWKLSKTFCTLRTFTTCNTCKEVGATQFMGSVILVSGSWVLHMW